MFVQYWSSPHVHVSVWKCLFSYSYALDSHQWFFKAWMELGTQCQKEMRNKIMIGLSIFFIGELFWCRSRITRHRARMKNSTVGIIIGFARWRTSFSSLASVCDGFDSNDIFIFYLRCAFLIGNLLISVFFLSLEKNQRLKFSPDKITRFYSERVYYMNTPAMNGTMKLV